MINTVGISFFLQLGFLPFNIHPDYVRYHHNKAALKSECLTLVFKRFLLLLFIKIMFMHFALSVIRLVVRLGCGEERKKETICFAFVLRFSVGSSEVGVGEKRSANGCEKSNSKNGERFRVHKKMIVYFNRVQIVQN